MCSLCLEKIVYSNVYRNVTMYLKTLPNSIRAIFAELYFCKFCEVIGLCENISLRIYSCIILMYNQAAIHEIQNAKYPSKRQLAKYSTPEN